MASALAAVMVISGSAFASAAVDDQSPISVTVSTTCYARSAVQVIGAPEAGSTTAITSTVVTGSSAGTFGGTKLTGAQVDIARTVVGVGKDLGISRRGVRIAVAVAMQESSLNPGAVNGVYRGLFQQLPDPVTGLYTDYDRTDLLGATRMFYNELVKRVPSYIRDTRTDWELGEVVQETNVGQNVEAWQPLAQDVIDKYYPKPKPKPATAAAPARPTSDTVQTVRFQPLRSAGAAFAVRAQEPTDSSVVGTGEPAPAQSGDSGTVTTSAAVDTTSTAAADDTGAGSTDAPSTDPAGTGTPTGPASTTAPVEPTTTAPVTTTAAVTSTSARPTSTKTDPTSTSARPTSTKPDPTKPATTEPTTKPTTTGTPTEPVTTSAPTTTAPVTTTAATTDPTSTAPSPTSTDPVDGEDPVVVDEDPVAPVPDDDSDPNLGPDPILPPVVPEAPSSGPDTAPTTDDCEGSTSPDTSAPSTNGGSTVFDAGNIISDQVFYNSKAMTTQQIREFLADKGQSCTGDACLKNLTVTTPDLPADRYCKAYRGGTDEGVAAVLARISVACGINPQVMLTTLQKESGLLTRSDVTLDSYDAAWGWHCPDTGPGGSANCDPQYAGFFNQAFGMAKQWSRYKVEPDNYRYQAGQTVEILWNVAETGCGGAPVTIENTATASLYNYTPYQPNAAALASYPGTGDECSAYGNRNFHFLFQKYFGVSGGGVPASISIKGVQVTIPAGANVAPGLAGKVVKAPNKKVAAGIAAGFASLGLPYVWGGGNGAGGGADQGCGRGGGSSNSCQGVVGFDCSGLTAYVLAKAGFTTGSNSSAQRSGGQDIAWNDALPGDIIGYSGHVAIYLGYIDGVEYLLEAPTVGSFVQIRPVYLSNGGVPVDSVMHRYWS